MDQQDKSVIDDLFGKLRQAEGKTGPRDPEAEMLIAEHIKSQPGAPYYMAQALVVQQDALANAQSRIQQLEQELTERPQGGGFLAGLFGGGEEQPSPQRRNVPAHAGRYRQQAQAGPWGGGGGGGFLAGAMQTALGVAGGVMIANAITGMFAADEAAAAELPPEDMAPEDMAAEDAGWDEPAADDFGGDDFDISGGAFDEF